jgi:membrane-bound metal-dependent hydrolase YbcI (DUF457 family)
MFIGHYGLALASKRFTKDTSLGTLFIASLLPDLIWPVMLLLGVERISIVPGATKVSPLVFEHYPFSHSLVATVLLACAFGVVYLIIRSRPKSAIITALLVMSHWTLDAISHRPDLPLTLFGEMRVGLGLWDSIPATIIVEGGIFLAGSALYLTSTRAFNKRGRYGAWALLLSLAFIYAGQFTGVTPPDARTVAMAGLLQWEFVGLGFWVDRHRKVL